MATGEWVTAVEAFARAQLAIGIADTSVRTRRQHLMHMARRVPCGPWEVDEDVLADYMASQRWARETRRGRRASLVAFYGWAVAGGRVELDPTAGLPKIKPGVPTPMPVPDDVYLSALIRADEFEAIWIDLGAEHGLRRAEMAQIDAADIIPTLLGHDLIVHGKGGKTRIVPLTPPMAWALSKLADGRRRGPLFPGGHNGHISPQWLGIRVSRLLGGIWTIHKLRHRAATRFWIAADGDPYTLAELMGWTNINMARVYVRLPDERKRAVVERASRTGAALTQAGAR